MFQDEHPDHHPCFRPCILTDPIFPTDHLTDSLTQCNIIHNHTRHIQAPAAGDCLGCSPLDSPCPILGYAPALGALHSDESCYTAPSQGGCAYGYFSSTVGASQCRAPSPSTSINAATLQKLRVLGNKIASATPSTTVDCLTGVTVEHAPSCIAAATAATAAATAASAAATATASAATAATLEEMLDWHHFFVAQLSDEEVEDLIWWLEQPMSTAFSGIEAPGVARNCQAIAVTARTGRQIRPVTLSTIEIDKEAQQELLIQQNGCVFEDLNDFYVPFLQPVVRQLLKTPAKAYDVLKPSVVAGVAVRAEAHCLRHGRRCKLLPAHVHVAGTCCQDHSDFGNKAALSGKSTPALLAWISLRLLLQETQIIQENVKSFPPSILFEFLGHLYHIEIVTLDSLMFAIPQHRERQYVMMRHKLKSLWQRSPLSWFVARLHREAVTSWLVFGDASVAELAAELRWALNRPDSRANNLKTNLDEITIHTPDAFELALNEMETDFLRGYRIRYPPRGNMPASYSLAQNPESGFGLVAIGPHLHTLIKNAQMLWCDTGLTDERGEGFRVKRWLTPRELLLVQCFPVRREGNNDQTSGLQLCSFNSDRPSDRERKRAAIVQQAGNSMTVPCVGALELFAACSCVHRVERRQSSNSLGVLLRRKMKRR